MSPKTVKVNQSLAASHNRRLTLRLLGRHGVLSRKQLADMTGMHGSTLSNIMAEFLRLQLVREIGKRESSAVGKKQTLVEINPRYGWVLGVGIHEHQVDVVAMNARRQAIGSFSSSLQSDPLELIPILGAVMEHNTKTPGRLLGIGIGFPGIVDENSGMIVEAPYLGVKDCPLGRTVSQELGVPTHVDNDVQISTLAEAFQRQATSRTTFIYFHANHVHDKSNDTYALRRFGLGMFLNGQLYRGSRFGAGFLPDVLRPSEFGGLTEEDLKVLAMPKGEVTERVRQLAEWLGPCLQPMVTLLDPEDIVLGGNLMLRNTAVVEIVEDSVRNAPASSIGSRIRVRSSMLPEHRVAYSAALTAVNRQLEALYPEETDTED